MLTSPSRKPPKRAWPELVSHPLVVRGGPKTLDEVFVRIARVKLDHFAPLVARRKIFRQPSRDVGLASAWGPVDDYLFSVAQKSQNISEEVFRQVHLVC